MWALFSNAPRYFYLPQLYFPVPRAKFGFPTLSSVSSRYFRMLVRYFPIPGVKNASHIKSVGSFSATWSLSQKADFRLCRNFVDLDRSKAWDFDNASDKASDELG